MKNLTTKARLIIVFLSIGIASYVCEILPDQVLGDWHCKGSKMIEIEDHFADGTQHFSDRLVGCSGFNWGYSHNPREHYGFRHWLVIVGGITLSIYSVSEIFKG